MKLIKRIILVNILLVSALMLGSLSASAQDHQHIFRELYIVKPTCTENGYTVFGCDCGEFYEGAPVDSLGHIFSEEVVCYKKPTCIERGEKGRFCERCFAKTNVVYLDKTAHTPETVKVKATTERNGEIKEECTVCKKIFSSKTVSKIASVKTEKKIYTYDGKVKKPSVTVKDIKGKTLTVNRDYFLKYQKGSKKTGMYSITVTFCGDYEGEKTLYFKIRPAAVKGISATPSVSSVYLSWNGAKGADGYEIYLKNKKTLKLLKDTKKQYSTLSRIDGKKLKSGTDYIFVIKGYKEEENSKIYSSAKTVKITTKPQKSKIKKIRASSGKVTVTISKQNCHGYEILLSTNKSFSNPKKITLKGSKKAAYNFKNLIKGRKYYVKCRAYVVSGGEKYYGFYSDAKSFRA